VMFGCYISLQAITLIGRCQLNDVTVEGAEPDVESIILYVFQIRCSASVARAGSNC